tara:strand:- start:5542 stop:5961 length:420 start_codon:yes stop_codon:yes gene_type:complete
MAIDSGDLVGGGGVPQLAPDISRLSTQGAGTSPVVFLTGIDGSSGPALALGLTGKHTIEKLEFLNFTIEPVVIRLEIDGVDIFNQSYTPSSTNIVILGGTISGNAVEHTYYSIKNSLNLYVTTTTDTSIDLNVLVRPIL